MKLAVIGDVHLAFNRADSAYFNASDHDAILFVGDIYSFSIQRGLKAASELANLQKPALLIPGNHDAIHPAQLAAEISGRQSLIRLTSAVTSGGQGRRVQALCEAVGGVQVGGYSVHALSSELDVITARPHSMGGSSISFSQPLLEVYGVSTLEESVQRLKQCVDQSEAAQLVFLAHNGPSGLGSERHDLWGCDFRREEGDFGDTDLRAAIDYAVERGKRVLAVIAGHMHHRLRGGGHRKWCERRDGILYVNAACVPRIFEERSGIFHHHVDIIIENGCADAIEVLRRGD